MRILAFVLFSLFSLLLVPQSAEAGIEARVNLVTQRMQVLVDGVQQFEWRVSTARKGYVTPKGQYQPKDMYKRYFSRKYHNSPMPYAIFYDGGYAVHGTMDEAHLGKPASHGCIRLDTANAAKLFDLVNQHGRQNTKFVVTS